jgi:hypothetical protein
MIRAKCGFIWNHPQWSVSSEKYWQVMLNSCPLKFWIMKPQSCDVEIPRMSEVDAEAVESLLAALGPMKTAAFVREHMWMKTDYLELKDQLFKGLSIESIAEEIKRTRKHEE